MDGHRPRPWRAENPTGNFTAERQSSRSPAENEKRLPHIAAVGGCDRRSDATKKKNGQQRMGISLAHRRPYVPGQRAAYAAESAETGRAAPHPIPRSPSHLRNHGPAKRRGRENRQQYARTLLRRLHAGHLRPRHHRRPTQSGANNGQYPIPCCLTVSATRSRWGQRLGQEKATSENSNL